MTETLLHYSRKPLGAVVSTVQSETPHMKPRGLWVSVQGEHDWESWCRGEDFALESFAVPPVEIILAPNANILRLTSDPGIIDFGRKYRDPARLSDCYSIDWRPVAAKYQGIIIAPYSWECRYHSETSWYYGWDCASGCIWDAAAVASVVAREQEAA